MVVAGCTSPPAPATPRAPAPELPPVEASCAETRAHALACAEATPVGESATPADIAEQACRQGRGCYDRWNPWAAARHEACVRAGACDANCMQDAAEAPVTPAWTSLWEQCGRVCGAHQRRVCDAILKPLRIWSEATLRDAEIEACFPAVSMGCQRTMGCMTLAATRPGAAWSACRSAALRRACAGNQAAKACRDPT
jgi:hypothetical protein